MWLAVDGVKREKCIKIKAFIYPEVVVMCLLEKSLSKCKNSLLDRAVLQMSYRKNKVSKPERINCAVTSHIKVTVSRKRGSSSLLTWEESLGMEIHYLCSYSSV